MAENTILRHVYQKKVYLNIRRPDKKFIEIISQVYTGFIADRLGKMSIMSESIKPLFSGAKICGPAVTSLGPDLTVRRVAIDTCQPGDILVVASGGSKDWACFGDGTASKMLARGGIGAIIDGSTRDAAGLRSMGFPVFCKGITPKNYYYPHGIDYGGVNVPVVVGNVLVNPGDLILGDDDGVIVIPFEQVESMCMGLLEAIENEKRERQNIKKDFKFNLLDDLKKLGYIVYE